jgi:hypothetical protein
MDLSELGSEIKDFTAQANSRLLAIEQKITAPNGGGGGSGDGTDIARAICESQEYKSFIQNNGRSTGRIPVGSFFTKTTIVNAPKSAASSALHPSGHPRPRTTVDYDRGSDAPHSHNIEFDRVHE